MKGEFSRVSPSSFAEKLGIPVGWVVVSWGWMPEKAARRRAHGRVFKISSGKQTVYRILRFSGNLKRDKASSSGEIVIDWPGWLELHDFSENVDPPLTLEIKDVPKWQLWRLALSHPDPTYRLAGILGLVSIGLGILSVGLALLPLFLD